MFSKYYNNLSINKFIKKYQNDGYSIELESRLGGMDKYLNKEGNIFRSVNKRDFYRVKSVLSELYGEPEVEESVIITYKKSDIRKVYKDNSVYYEEKIKQNIDVSEHPIRLSLSAEKKYNKRPKNSPRDKMKARERYRELFNINDIEVSFTKVESYNINNDEERQGNSFFEYQIEMEIIGLTDIDQNISNLENISRMILSHYLDTRILYTEKERIKTAELFVSLLDVSLVLNSIPNRILNKPIDLEIQELKYSGLLMMEGGFTVTLKADGIRKYLFVSEDGIYLIFPDVIKIYGNDKAVYIDVSINKISDYIYDLTPNTILDGEIINYSQSNEDTIIYYVFDLLVYNKKNRMNYNLLDRLSISKKMLKETDVIHIKEKRFIDFYDVEGFYGACNEILSDEGKVDFEIDGLIFTPIEAPYIPESTKLSRQNNTTLTRKWKPQNMLTIDFEVAIIDDEYVPRVKNRKNELERFLNVKITQKPKRYDTDIKEYKEGLIYEFAWDYDKGLFYPVRERLDKDFPNFIESAKSIYTLIQNPISKETITGKNLQLMRLYHREVKRTNIENINGKSISRILDIGSGYGQDILLWKRLKSIVYAVEPNSDNIKEFKSRLESVFSGKRSNINIEQLSGEDTNEITEFVGEKKVDVVTIISVLTFMYKSEDNINRAINTITNNLKNGGILMIFVTDGKKLSEYLPWKGKNIKITNVKKRKFSTSIQISMDTGSGIVNNQKEYLVDCDDLNYRLQNKGFKKMFDSYMNTELFMTKEELKYSSTQRLMIFKYYASEPEKFIYPEKEIKQLIKDRYYTHPEILDIPKYLDESEDVIDVNDKQVKITRIGTNGLFDSYLYHTNPEYANLSGKRKLIKTEQKRLSSMISIEIYNKYNMTKYMSYEDVSKYIIDENVLPISFVPMLEELLRINIYLFMYDQKIISLNKMKDKYEDSMYIIYVRGRYNYVKYNKQLEDILKDAKSKKSCY